MMIFHKVLSHHAAFQTHESVTQTGIPGVTSIHNSLQPPAVVLALLFLVF